MTRKKRDYEKDLPEHIDLDGADVDYSVMLAEADKMRADAAIAVQKYRLLKEAEERVARINAGMKRMLGASDG